MKKTSWLFTAVLSCLVIATLFPQMASAATFTLDVTTTNDTLIVDGDCSLREAIETANTLSTVYAECFGGVTPLPALAAGDDFVINVPAGTYAITLMGANEDANQTGDFDIMNTVVINGIGAATIIDAGMMDRAFHVMATADINDLTIQNGMVTTTSPTDGGGAILNEATLSVSGATISNNAVTGTGASGGGIMNNMGVLTVVDSTFSMNDSVRAGGGIESNVGDMTITNTDFDMNSTGATPGNGGAIHITGAGSAMITGGNATNNTASAEGGGFWNGSGTMTVDGTTFTDNVASGASADQGGGALFNAGGTLDVMNATITDNDANGAAGSGGGILNDMGVLTVSDSMINGNTSMRAGGGIESNIGDTTVQNTDFDGNSTGAAPGNGGAIHITGAGAADIQGGIVSNNFASAEGGGFWNGSGTMTVLGATFTDNEAAGAGADQGGGALFNAGGTLIATQILADGNTATGAAGSGGAILNDMGDLTVILSNINNNTSVRAGGGIESNVGNTTLFNTNFDMNNTESAPGNGGALHITGAGNVFATGGDVTNNTASAEGGGFWNGSGTMTINATDFLMNSAAGDGADQGGGGLFNAGGTLIVSNSDIDGNMATGTAGSGGGVLNDMGVLTITMSTITDNDSNRAGGGVEAVAGSTYLEQVFLDGNSTGNAPGNGGGLHLTGAGFVEVKDSTVSNNFASNEGGGLWNSVAGTFIVDGTTVNNNESPLGAGLHNDGGMFFAYNTTVSMNAGDGFANVDGGTATLTHVTIHENTLGINNADGMVSISNSIVTDCTGTISAMGVNLDEDGSCMASITADPMLGALMDNGGFNATHLPMEGSVVVDAADNAVATANPANNEDQRDVNRTLDSFSDIGAVERKAVDGMLTIAKVVPSIVELSGTNEVPAVDSPAMGTAIVSYDPVTMMLDYHISIETTMPITITMAHIHTGTAGTNGGVLAGILSGGPYTVADTFSFSGSVMLTDAQAATLLAQGYYINIHTTANPGGELRGQLLPPPVTTMPNPDYNPDDLKPEPVTLPINFFVSDPMTGEAVTLTGGTSVSYDLPIGTYTTDEITIPDGWMLVGSTCSDGSMPNSIMIGEGEMVTCSFTNVMMTPPPVTGRVSNMIWSEVDGDMMFTAGVDMPLAGVIVSLRTADGIELFAQTNANGMYEFEGVPVDTMFTVDVADATLPAEKQGNVVVDSDGTLDGMTTGMITSDAPGDFTIGFGYGAVVDPVAGTLVIAKVETGQANGTVTLPGMTPFTFSDPTNADNTFTLVGGESRMFSVMAGTYMVDEVVPDEWMLAGATCDNGDDPQTGVTVGESETVTCTFTNEEIPVTPEPEMGMLTIMKVEQGATMPGTTPFMFSDPTNMDSTFTLIGGEGRTFTVMAGTYTVMETVPDGWMLADATCSNGDDPTTGVAVGEGENVMCTFTNMEIPVETAENGTLIIAKTLPATIQLSGTERVPFIDTNAMGEAMLTYNPATMMLDYNVTVTADPEMPLTFTGASIRISDNGTDGGVLVSLVDGASIVVDESYMFSGSVMIPADAVARLLDGRGYTLHIHTETHPNGEIIGLLDVTSTPMIDNPDYDSSDLKETDPMIIPLPFTFNNPSDPSMTFTLGGSMQQVFTVTAGTYIITEQMIPDGWMLADTACSNGDDPQMGVMVSEGETVVCAFTNMEIVDVQAGMLTIVKAEEGATMPSMTPFMFSDPTDASSMFTLVGGQSRTFNVMAGTYMVDEIVPDGWMLTGATCDNGNDPQMGVSVGEGENVTCTFTNMEIPAAEMGTLTVTKVEQGATMPGTTPFLFTNPIDGMDTFTLVGGESRTFSVISDTYFVTEAVPDGWMFVSAMCDNGADPRDGVIVGEGETVVCTFTNMETPVGTISGRLWSEEGEDGVYTPAEDTLLSDVIVRLTAPDGTERFATTESDGTYLFENVPLDVEFALDVVQSTLPVNKEGNVSIDPDGGEPDGSAMVTLTADMPDNTVQGFAFEFMAPTAVTTTSISSAVITSLAVISALLIMVIVLTIVVGVKKRVE